MTTSPDSPSKPTLPRGRDLATYFEPLWRSLDLHPSDYPEPRSLEGTIHLECTGGLLDVQSLGCALVRHTTAGPRVEFVCPECGALHDSALARTMIPAKLAGAGVLALIVVATLVRVGMAEPVAGIAREIGCYAALSSNLAPLIEADAMPARRCSEDVASVTSAAVFGARGV
jgi:hypothetical protein